MGEPIRPLSVPFVLCTSGFSQSSCLDLEPTEAALSIPFLYNVQATMYNVHIVVAEATQRQVITSLGVFFLCGYYAKKSVTTQN